MQYFRNIFILTVAASKLFLGILFIPSGAHSQLDPNFVTTSKTKIEALRKRDCQLTITSLNGSPSNLKVTVKQIRSHFGMGAAIGYDQLNANPAYAENFLKFFEWAVFENDMKWPATDPTSNGPDYSKADSLIRFCQKNDIKVRGHNLFWNQQEDWFPAWTLPLSTTDFKTAVDKRITNAMTHFKGKVEHWDIVNEIIHGSVLQDHSGDATIINSIFTKAHAIDTAMKTTVNDFNILVWNSAEDYITNIKNMLNNKVPVNIVGCEGHFGDNLSQDYAAKLDRVATLGLPIWVTELDFSTKANPADGFEKLMRTFYGHPKVEGVMMWAWWGGNLWREDLNSHFVNTDFTLTPVGERFLQLKKEWTTQDSGQTDASGHFSFKGFQGRYEVTIKTSDTTFVDTLDLEPVSPTSTGTKQWSLHLPAKPVGVSNAYTDLTQKRLRIEGMPIVYQGPLNTSLSISFFGTDGKLQGAQTIYPNQIDVKASIPTGQFLYRLQLHDHILKEGMGLKL